MANVEFFAQIMWSSARASIVLTTSSRIRNAPISLCRNHLYGRSSSAMEVSRSAGAYISPHSGQIATPRVICTPRIGYLQRLHSPDLRILVGLSGTAEVRRKRPTSSSELGGLVMRAMMARLYRLLLSPRAKMLAT